VVGCLLSRVDANPESSQSHRRKNEYVQQKEREGKKWKKRKKRRKIATLQDFSKEEM
jgi:hypothetical protein